MVWTEDFRSGHAAFYPDGGTEDHIYGVTNINVTGNAEIRKETSSGKIWPDTVSQDAIRPSGSFSTFDIRNALDTLGATSQCVTKGDTEYGLRLWSQKQTCAGVAGGSVHATYTIGTGIVGPRTLSVDHRGNCSMVYQFWAAYDGSNDPVIRATSQALPAYPASPVGRWTMQGMSVGGTAVEGKRNITIDFGVQVTQEGADSEPFDSVTSLTAEQPRVTIRGVQPSWFESVLALEGEQVTHANTWMWLQRRNYAVGTTEHIKLTFAGLASWDTIYDGGVDAPGESVMAIDLLYDGTNNPIVVSTGVAIT